MDDDDDKNVVVWMVMCVCMVFDSFSAKKHEMMMMLLFDDDDGGGAAVSIGNINWIEWIGVFEENGWIDVIREENEWKKNGFFFEDNIFSMQNRAMK